MAPMRPAIDSHLNQTYCMYNVFLFCLLTLMLNSCIRDRKYPYRISDFRPELRPFMERVKDNGQLSAEDTLARNYLSNNCTKIELVNMLNCNVPELRITAYIAIVNRKYADYFPLLLKHLDDTAKIIRQPTDGMTDIRSITDIMIDKVSYIINSEEKDELEDSVLLRHDHLRAAESMLEQVKPQEKYYKIIRRKAGIKGNDCIQMWYCYALAKFRKKTDINLIKEIINTNEGYDCNYLVFKTIETFPDSAFFVILENYLRHNIKNEGQFGHDGLKWYTKAVAAYRSTEALRILSQLSQKSTYYDSTYIYRAQRFVFISIHKHFAPVYRNLYVHLGQQMDSVLVKNLTAPDYNDRTIW
jgi:hypothetical protein